MHIETVKIPGTIRDDRICQKKSLASFGKHLVQF
jgi:hypothetical protein